MPTERCHRRCSAVASFEILKALITIDGWAAAAAFPDIAATGGLDLAPGTNAALVSQPRTRMGAARLAGSGSGPHAAAATDRGRRQAASVLRHSTGFMCVAPHQEFLAGRLLRRAPTCSPAWHAPGSVLS